MRHTTAVSGRHRRRSHVPHAVRRRWADYVVMVVLVAVCLIALLLLVDVIDTTFSKPERLGAARIN
jgi:hypothetical protein